MGTEWVEPTEEKRAGHGTLGVRRLTTIYSWSLRVFRYRDFGVQRCQDLPMKPWDRLGGNGLTFSCMVLRGPGGCTW